MSWANLISGLISLVNKLVGFFHDKRQQELGAKEAELESRKEQDALIDTIKSAQSNDSVRESTRKKYTRKGDSVH